MAANPFLAGPQTTVRSVADTSACAGIWATEWEEGVHQLWGATCLRQEGTLLSLPISFHSQRQLTNGAYAQPWHPGRRKQMSGNWSCHLDFKSLMRRVHILLSTHKEEENLQNGMQRTWGVSLRGTGCIPLHLREPSQLTDLPDDKGGSELHEMDKT